MQELIVRLKALMHKAFVEKEITNTYTIGGYQFNSVTQQLDFAGNIQELSHRESEILKRLCENRNEVVNSQSILLELWGDDSFFNSRSLHVFITKLRHKLSKDQSIRIVNVQTDYKLTLLPSNQDFLPAGQGSGKDIIISSLFQFQTFAKFRNR